MATGQILSVVAAAVAAWLIGWLWYTALSKPWVAANGYTPERLAAMRAKAGVSYLGSLVALLVIAAVLRILISHLGGDTPAKGAAWGFHAWLGFALPLGFMSHLFSERKAAAFAIDLGYQFVYFVAMGAILGAWHLQ